jgi:hypothetical protein
LQIDRVHTSGAARHWRCILKPEVDRQLFLAQAARPQPIDEDADSVAGRGSFVGALHIGRAACPAYSDALRVSCEHQAVCEVVVPRRSSNPAADIDVAVSVLPPLDRSKLRSANSQLSMESTTILGIDF